MNKIDFKAKSRKIEKYLNSVNRTKPIKNERSSACHNTNEVLVQLKKDYGF